MLFSVSVTNGTFSRVSFEWSDLFDCSWRHQAIWYPFSAGRIIRPSRPGDQLCFVLDPFFFSDQVGNSVVTNNLPSRSLKETFSINRKDTKRLKTSSRWCDVPPSDFYCQHLVYRVNTVTFSSSDSLFSICTCTFFYHIFLPAPVTSLSFKLSFDSSRKQLLSDDNVERVYGSSWSANSSLPYRLQLQSPRSSLCHPESSPPIDSSCFLLSVRSTSLLVRLGRGQERQVRAVCIQIIKVPDPSSTLPRSTRMPSSSPREFASFSTTFPMWYQTMVSILLPKLLSLIM